MKILIVHNDYGKYSGEEAVVDRMIDDGRRSGIEIEVLRRTSKFSRDNLIGKIRGFFNGIYSWSGCRMMKEALNTFRPDIVHIHNLYPFISPAVLKICKRRGFPVVMTVHNYRLICPTGLFLRDGKPCEECLVRGNEWGCILHNCEHDKFRSLGYALRNMVARWTRAYIDNVDYFCCLTTFQKEKLIQAGYNRDKIWVFPNYVEYIVSDEINEQMPEYGLEFIGYVGRLSHEKGYDLLIEIAKRHPEIQFRFAGTIREDDKIEIPSNVKLCGLLSQERLARFYDRARFIVIPSRCYEGFPVVMLEASSHKCCCVAPNHGAFPDLITDKSTGAEGGLLFKPLDVDDLENKIMHLWNNPQLCTQLGQVAEENYRKRFLKEKLNITWDKFLRQVAANHKANHPV